MSHQAVGARVVFALAALMGLGALACPRQAAGPTAAVVIDAGAKPRPIDAAALLAQTTGAGQPATSPVWDANAIDQAVATAIAESKLPGCVVVVGSHERIFHRRAYGSRSVDPEREPMQLDTIFDLASLTKTMATATSLLALEEKGVLALDDPASKFVPAFAGRGKEAITLRQLLH